MGVNENTYQYIDSVFCQLEGVTCALASFLEKNGLEISSYQYKVFNNVYNDIREDFIASICSIKSEFEVIRNSVEESVTIMKASEEAKTCLKESLDAGENCIDRLIIRCNSIERAEQPTGNPWIVTNAEDGVYRLFGGYTNLIDQYNLQKFEDEEDVIAKSLYSFYEICIEKYKSLFKEYNRNFSLVGKVLAYTGKHWIEEQDKRANAIVKRNTAVKKIAKSAGKLGITAAEAFISAGIVSAAVMTFPVVGSVSTGIVINVATAFGIIKKKNLGDVAKETIGLVATISENMDDIIQPTKNKSEAEKLLETGGDFKENIGLMKKIADKYPKIICTEDDNRSSAREMLKEESVDNKKINKKELSAGRKILKECEKINRTIGIVDAIAGSNLSSSKKIAMGVVLASETSKQIVLTKEKDSVEALTAVFKNSRNLIEIGSNTIMNIAAHNWISAGINLCQMPTRVIDLIAKTGKYVKKNEVNHELPIIGEKLYNIGKQLENYERRMEKYRYNKAKGFEIIKPKPPKWIIGVKMTGWLADKIDKNGENINEVIRSVL